jgi:hypothetical protein
MVSLDGTVSVLLESVWTSEQDRSLLEAVRKLTASDTDSETLLTELLLHALSPPS